MLQTAQTLEILVYELFNCQKKKFKTLLYIVSDEFSEFPCVYPVHAWPALGKTVEAVSGCLLPNSQQMERSTHRAASLRPAKRKREQTWVRE